MANLPSPREGTHTRNEYIIPNNRGTPKIRCPQGLRVKKNESNQRLDDTSAPIELETHARPDAAVIWLHGLGADGNDFVPVVSELALPAKLGIRFIFPHAPLRPVTCNGGYVMRAWYDIDSLENFRHEDATGLAEACTGIDRLIAGQLARGIPVERIVLMGFSQGAATALYAGLRHPHRLAGIGALSCYLPLAGATAREIHTANTDVSIFMAHGLHDPVVLYRYGEQARDTLSAIGCVVDWHSYPMEHSLCSAEIADIATWLTARLGHTTG